MSGKLASSFKLGESSQEWHPQVAPEVEEVVVAVMGMTGSGKSTLIKTITGAEDIVVGHSLQSCTTDVNSYRCTIQGVRFVLVDTPGFNDTFKDDKEILKEITDWLSKTYASGKRLNGLIYLHPICNPRVEGSSLMSLRMFRELCGKECYQHIFLCTTFWDLVSHETGISRERELCGSADLWGHMRQCGSSVHRFNKYREAKDVLLMIAKLPSVTLNVQKEVVESSLPIESTAAGMVVDEQMMTLKRRLEHQRLVVQQVAASKLADHDAAHAERLKAEEERVERLRQEQAEVFDEQRKYNEKLQRELRDAAETRLQQEREAKVRMQLEAKAREAAQRSERANLEAEARRRSLAAEAALRAQRDRWKRQDRRMRLNFLLISQLRLLERAGAIGVLRALVMRVDNQNDAFTRVCDYCHRLVGCQRYYRCETCDYDVCQRCYTGRSLNDLKFHASHHVRHILKLRPNGKFCNRLDPTSLGSKYTFINCDRCGKRCEGLCIHCCLCDDENFDMCLECATLKGATCYNPRHSLHPMFAPLPE